MGKRAVDKFAACGFLQTQLNTNDGEPAVAFLAKCLSPQQSGIYPQCRNTQIVCHKPRARTIRPGLSSDAVIFMHENY